MANHKDALACMEAMHARLGRLESLWDARYTRRRGEEPTTVRNSVQRLSNSNFWPDNDVLASRYGTLELVSAFADQNEAEAETWMTTQHYGTIHAVKLMEVLRHTETTMGVSCPTTVCQAEIELQDMRYKKQKYYITIKFRKVTEEQGVVLSQPGKTIAETELHNILNYLNGMGEEVRNLFPVFIMAMRVHHRTTGSIWEGIGMKTLERVTSEQRATSGFFREAMRCLEKLHRAGASHGNPSLASFMLKRMSNGATQLCMTNLSTFRPFPLRDWSAERYFQVTTPSQPELYNDFFLTKVMMLMDYLKLLWLGNRRFPLYLDRGEDWVNERYLRMFHKNEEADTHSVFIAPWLPTRLLCFQYDWDIQTLWAEVHSFPKYLRFFDAISPNDLALTFTLLTNSHTLQHLNQKIRLSE